MQYDIIRSVRDLKVELINDPTMRFGAQLLTRKLLRGNRPNKVSAGCVCAVEKCAMGVTISWAHFLVEEFKIDCLEA